MINSQEIKIGTCIRLDGKIWTCIDFQHRKPGKGNTVMITKLKNVSDGRVLERTFQVGFKLEDVRVERRPYQYLYQDPTGYIFMNQETFEQIGLTEEDLGDAVNFLIEEMIIQVLMYEGTPVGVELPNTVIREVTYTEPGLKGDTIGRATKPATISTGYTLQVPLFVVIGDKIKIDTRTGEYLERAN